MEQRADYITKNETQPAPKPWRCRGCGRVLGVTSNGLLYVNHGPGWPIQEVVGKDNFFCPCGHVTTWEYRRLRPSARTETETPLFVEWMKERRAAMDAAFDMLEEDLRETRKA